MRPVGQMQENIVASCIQYQEGDIGKAQDPETVCEICLDFSLPILWPPSIRLHGTESDRTQNYVDSHEVSDEEGLTTCRNMTDT
jgi:hypothetical protein